VTDSFLKAHRDAVQKVVYAIVDAIQREKSDRAYAESVIAKHFKIKDKAEIAFTYDFYLHEVLAPEPVPTVAQLQSNIDAMAVSNPKVKSINAASMIDQSFVKNAEKRLGKKK
jgi:ABC-type nitrate/sulfonate/bicarbonate transport system substrate-binding protein